MPDTYLVTGGAGFIGSHTVEALLARGHSVIVVDNLSTGSAANLAAVERHPRMRFIVGTVLDEVLIDALTAESDVVIHLAASVGVQLIIDRPLQSFMNNLRGSEVVISTADRYHRKILVASTSEVYGKNGVKPLREDDDRLVGGTRIARWSYSTAKAVDETLAFAYHKQRGLEAVVVRLFNTVGPRQSPAYGMVVPRLVRQAVAGESLTVFGDGRQTRCFCHVHDVVRALLTLLDEPAAVGEAFNVGAPDEISIAQLAERILAATGSPAPIDLVPYEQAYDADFEDMRRRVPDISKLQRLTGWAPSHSLGDILDEVIAEARQEQAREEAALREQALEEQVRSASHA